MNATSYQVGDSVAVKIPMPRDPEETIEVAAKVRGVVIKKGRPVVIVQLGTGHALKRCYVSASRLRLMKASPQSRRRGEKRF